MIAVLLFTLTQPSNTPTMGCDGGYPTGLAAVFACECTGTLACNSDADCGYGGDCNESTHVCARTCNIGKPCPGDWVGPCDDGTYGTCETTLWYQYNGNTCIPANFTGLDVWTGAETGVETFSPVCPLTFTIASRGTAMFKDVFGWYNVTGAAPTVDDLHVMLDCNSTEGSTAVLNLKSDPAWLGGEIGFFIITPEDRDNLRACDPANSSGDNCCASKERLAAGTGYVYYSQRTFNPDSATLSHMRLYDSGLVVDKFYFAWEDLFNSPGSDFTDFVTSVEGVQCAGGGTPCDTGADGVCGYGVNSCASGVLSCQPLYTAAAEDCDGLDDDCDGVIDDGAVCPNADEICQNGICVPNCAVVNEFDCPPSMQCDSLTGRCYDPLCVGLEPPCDANEICRAGACVGDCDGVVCPYGQVCRLGSCLDPCAEVTCGANEVCANGLCVPGCDECGGMMCYGDDSACNESTGECYDPRCPAGCPPGEHCVGPATCEDSCIGATCPTGQVCLAGACTVPLGPIYADAGPGAPDASGGGGNNDEGDSGGCGCARAGAAPTASNAAAPLLLAGLCLLGARRRRKK